MFDQIDQRVLALIQSEDLALFRNRSDRRRATFHRQRSPNLATFGFPRPSVDGAALERFRDPVRLILKRRRSVRFGYSWQFAPKSKNSTRSHSLKTADLRSPHTLAPLEID